MMAHFSLKHDATRMDIGIDWDRVETGSECGRERTTPYFVWEEWQLDWMLLDGEKWHETVIEKVRIAPAAEYMLNWHGLNWR